MWFLNGLGLESGVLTLQDGQFKGWAGVVLVQYITPDWSTNSLCGPYSIIHKLAAMGKLCKKKLHNNILYQD